MADTQDSSKNGFEKVTMQEAETQENAPEHHEVDASGELGDSELENIVGGSGAVERLLRRPYRG